MQPGEIRKVVDKWTELIQELGPEYPWVQVRNQSKSEGLNVLVCTGIRKQGGTGLCDVAALPLPS